MGPAGRILDVEVRQGFPATAKTDDLDVVLATALSHALDDSVEAWHVAAAREDADALFRHAHSLYWHAVTDTSHTAPPLNSLKVKGPLVGIWC